MSKDISLQIKEYKAKILTFKKNILFDNVMKRGSISRELVLPVS